MTDELNEKELKLMFHTLGYDFTPRWNDEKGGFRNYFYTHENTSDYLIIKGLIDKGYMIDNGVNGFGGDGRYYSCTNKANSVVVDLWLKKKKENRPSRSKRRYQAYLSISEYFDDFGHFLRWLKVTDEDRIIAPKDVEFVEDIKRRWDI